MIRIGPAGIPLSCKGRTLKDGIIYTKSLELDALEVQFVRGIRMTEEDAAEVREVAEAAEVELHVHAPYYTNLAGDARNIELSRDKVMKAANLAHIMGAHTVAVHPGFYGDLSPNEAMERIVSVAGELRDAFKENEWKPKLAIEMMGKRSVFGSLEEVVEVCRQVDDVLPVVDFAHIHARGNGSLNTVEDFQEVFDKLIPLGLHHYLIHFTGVLYENGNERHHLPIKKGDLRFEPLVEAILENDYNVTLISTSPILEHDAMYMQIVLDRVKEKREQRLQKDAVRQQQDQEKAVQEEEKAKKDEEARKAAEAAEAARKAAEEKARAEAEPRPMCAAVTHAGDPCKNPARTNSKYCSSHRGYRPTKAQREAMDALEKKAAAKKGGAKAGKAKEPAAESKDGAGKAVKKTASTKRQPAKRTRKEITPQKAAESGKTRKATKKTAAKKTAKPAPKKATKKAAKKPAAAKKTAAKKAATKKAAAKKRPQDPAKKATKKATKKTPTGQKRSPPASQKPATAPEAKKGRFKAAADRLLGRKKG